MSMLHGEIFHYQPFLSPYHFVHIYQIPPSPRSHCSKENKLSLSCIITEVFQPTQYPGESPLQILQLNHLGWGSTLDHSGQMHGVKGRTCRLHAVPEVRIEPAHCKEAALLVASLCCYCCFVLSLPYLWPALAPFFASKPTPKSDILQALSWKEFNGSGEWRGSVKEKIQRCNQRDAALPPAPENVWSIIDSSREPQGHISITDQSRV